MYYILRIISVLILLSSCNIALATDRPARFDKPEDAVAWLYRDFGWEAFIGQYFHEIINDQPKSVLQRYFTPKLAELIIKERKFEVETKQVGPPGFMLLFGSQDPDGISNIRINRKPGTDIISVLYDQNGEKNVMEINYLMIKTQTGWRISDVQYKTRESTAFPSPGIEVSLLKVLSGPY